MEDLEQSNFLNQQLHSFVQYDCLLLTTENENEICILRSALRFDPVMLILEHICIKWNTVVHFAQGSSKSHAVVYFVQGSNKKLKILCVFITIMLRFSICFSSHKISLTLSLFIEVPVPSHESERGHVLCICVLGVLILPISVVFFTGF